MLVIFDCDGVLVDSETLAAEVFSACLATYGVKLSAQDCYTQFHGHTLPYCYSWIEKNFFVRLPSTFDGHLKKETQERFAKQLQPVDGVEALLDSLLEKKITFCVASNGEHKKIDHSLSVTGLARYFISNNGVQKRFSREDVTQGKPAPDLFLLAAKVNGYSPENCIVVEDSASGFAAATAAGMRLIQYKPQSMSIGEDAKVLCCSAMSEVAGAIFTR